MLTLMGFQNFIFSNELKTNGLDYCNGFKLVEVQKDSIFESLGLKKGDCLMRINDKRIKKLSEIQNFYHELKTSTEFVIVLSRFGKTETFKYNIK